MRVDSCQFRVCVCNRGLAGQGIDSWITFSSVRISVTFAIQYYNRCLTFLKLSLGKVAKVPKLRTDGVIG